MSISRPFFICLLLFCLQNISYAQSKQVPKTGIIKGIVTALNTNQPLADACISVVNDTITVLTNAQGEYTILHARLGYQSLYVTCDGYRAQLSESFLVSASTITTVDLALEELAYDVKEVIVSASPLLASVESPVSMRRIGTEEIEMTPGANRDISKVVQSAPGVITTSVQRNDILVRGGGANENRYFLDGIEIPVLNHFAIQGGSGGNASLINTDHLQSVNFYTGAFPANFSNGLSSVMDMRLKSGNSEQFTGKLTLGASDVGLSLDTPLSKDGNTTLLASYRRSYLQMLFSVLGLPFLPTYNDYQIKLNTRFKSGDELSFVGLGSFDKNRLNTGLKDPDEGQQYILGYLPENDQSSYVVGATYRHPIRNGQMRFILSRNQFDNLLYKYTDDNSALPKTLNYDTRQSDNRMRVELERWYTSGLRFTGGIGGGSGSYRSNTMRTIMSGTTPQSDNYRSNLNIYRYEFFATLSQRFFANRLSVLVGLRGDGMNYGRSTANPLEQLSPRLSIAYDLSTKWGINASIARYYQEPPYTTIGYRNPAGVEVNKLNNLRYIAANHYIVGVEFKPNTTSRLSLEGFYKQYSDYPVSLIDSLPLSTGDFADYTVGDLPVRSVGRGRAYGAEFSYRNLDLKNTVLNLSYTFLYSQFNKMDEQLRPTSAYVSSSWDVRHILNLSLIHKFERNWVLGAKWHYVGGFPYTPYDAELSSRIDAWEARRRPYNDYSRYNSEASNPYHQLDIRVDKMWYFRAWRVGFYIDIQNLYNFKSDGQALLMPETDAAGNYRPDPARPGHYLMKSVEHQVGGTILPTLGLVIEF